MHIATRPHTHMHTLTQRSHSHTLPPTYCSICKTRLNNATKKALKAAGYKDKRVLTIEDLAKALREVGGGRAGSTGGAAMSTDVHECRGG